MNIGYIGIGIMGRPMAENLIKAGHTLFVHNRTLSKCDPLKELGASVWTSPAHVASVSEILFINVTDTPDVEAVLFGTDGVMETGKPGLIVVDNSTISPSQTKIFAARLKEREIDFLDAPVSGGDMGAQKGTLSIMVGGEKAVFDKCLPLFESLGSKITHVGEVGLGQTCKACNQLFCALHMLACSEGISLAKKAGLDPATMVEVVSSGAGGSWALTNLGPKIVAGDMAPGFMIDLLCKDLNYTIDQGQQINQKLIGAALAQKLFEQARTQGYGREGTQALYRVIEDSKTGRWTHECAEETVG